MSDSKSTALNGIRVLDLSRVLAGPWATQILADLGAEVIKIERPGKGDDTRSWGPPWMSDQSGDETDVASYYLCANRNKKSVTIDISTPEGQQLIRQLASQSDVLVENYKLGGLQKYGLDYASLHELNPQLIYCSITGFGQTGPYANRAGYDFLVQGMGGLMSITGRPDGEAGAGPIKVGVALTDILTGLYAANAIQAALLARNHMGLGQHIDMALLDVQLACLANQAAAYLATGVSPVRLGNAHPSIVPYQDFPTADGYMILAIGNDSQFARFCAESGQAELAANPKYANNSARVENRSELIPILRHITTARTTAQWVADLEKCAVPCGPINNMAEVFADPQVIARNLKINMPHELLGQVPLVANPINLSVTPVDYSLPPPQLGEHTETVLKEILKLDNNYIKDLQDRNLI